MSLSFKKFYKEEQHKNIFEKTFNKYYNRGHWGKITREEIYEQQKDWFNKLKMIIEEKDFGSLVDVLGHRDNKVSRELFSRVTRINIKKAKTQLVKEKLHDFCFNESLKQKNRGIEWK